MAEQTLETNLPREHTAVRAALRLLPSPPVILALALGGVLIAINIAKGFQDPDYFWHITTGRLIATTGHVPTTDPYSFTWGGQPWTAHEWLGELLMYWISQAIGEIGLLLVFGVFPAAIFGVLVWTLHKKGVRLVAIALPCVLAGWVLVPYVTLRPQAISWLMMAILIGWLWNLRPEKPWLALGLGPFFVLWANLHGLWVVGLGVVGLYFLFTLARRTPMASAWRWMLAATVLCALGTMVTPAGPIGILYPLRYIQPGNWGLANIQEWQSPSFHEPAHWALLAMILLIALNGGRATPGWLVFLSYLGVVMSLMALRNTPIAAVWAVPTLALGLEDRLAARSRNRRTRVHPPPVALVRRLMEITVAAVVVVMAFAITLPPSLATAAQTNVAKRFPVAAANVLVKQDPTVRLFTEYSWGGYMIYRLHWVGGTVFVDGRNEMYSEQILNDYSSIRAADPGWQKLVAQYGVQAILLEPSDTLVKGPAQDAGWCELYRDDVAVLLEPCSPGG